MTIKKRLAAFLLASVAMLGAAGCYPHHHHYDDHHPATTAHGSRSSLGCNLSLNNWSLMRLGCLLWMGIMGRCLNRTR
jgi:hypothetical protein